ncbi:hypothetical protein [Mesorhizobium carmichaelinearum]|uniref:hypothetical protein n=1 Tax=Mesorhizobium carmichaelinearum TaxID=1208188 RepID=UPI00118127E5|nr:hypothetical protein [Mesorhizobium carmichaelinearum]
MATPIKIADVDAQAPSLSALLQEWFAAAPERLAHFGLDGSSTVEEAVAALLNDKYQSPAIPAKLMLEAFKNDADPVARQIVVLLGRIA